METLKWLRSEGCPWDEGARASAAIYGHLDVLRWLIDNGCPYEANEYTSEALKSLGLPSEYDPPEDLNPFNR